MKNNLTPTTVRLTGEAVELLDEAAGLLRSTRADIIRGAMNTTLHQWVTIDRRKIIEKLACEFDWPQARCGASLTRFS